MIPTEPLTVQDLEQQCRVFDHEKFSLLGAIPFDRELLSPRTCDVVDHLQAKVLLEGEMHHRRIQEVRIVARSVSNMINTLMPNTLVITPGDVRYGLNCFITSDLVILCS